MPGRTPYRIGEYELLLTDRDIRVLETLEQFRLLDTRLIQRLQFPVGNEPGQHRTALSATRVATRVLGRLEGHGFLARVGRRVGGSGHGSGQTVWQLASAGERLLRARRGETGRRRYVDPGTGFLDHTLAVARTAAGLIEGSRTQRFDLLELETEPQSWRSFQSAHGGALTLKPDLFAVTADTESETHSFIEVDRATEHLPAILRKCRLYQQYWQSGTEQARADGLFPSIVWLVPTATRAERITAAIRADPQLEHRLFIATTSEHLLDLVAPLTT